MSVLINYRLMDSIVSRMGSAVVLTDLIVHKYLLNHNRTLVVSPRYSYALFCGKESMKLWFIILFTCHEVITRFISTFFHSSNRYLLLRSTYYVARLLLFFVFLLLSYSIQLILTFSCRPLSLVFEMTVEIWLYVFRLNMSVINKQIKSCLIPDSRAIF